MTDETRPRSVLAAEVPPHRLHAARRELVAYRQFVAAHALDEDTASVVLYLTHLLRSAEASGQQLRQALARLDLAVACEGRHPPSKHRDIRLFLRGAHRHAPLGPAVPRCEPLYREKVRLLIGDLDRPQPRQLRDIACLLIVNATGTRYPAVRDLRWRDVRLQKHEALVRLPVADQGWRRFTLPADTDPRVTPTHVLRALRKVDGPGDGPVLAQRGERAGSMRYHRLLTSIGATTLKTHSLGTPWTTRRRLIAAVEPLWALQTAALRDRALITLSFLAALTNAEAAALNVHDVRITPGGLVVNLPFRPTPQVGLPTGQDSKFCPVVAWTAWLNRYDADGPLPAFPRLRPMGMRISGDPLTATGLSDVVKDRCERAGLEGAFTFSSLRTGFIRTAIRADLPAALIAQHTGLRQVRTIDYERDREHILDGGAATLIGL